MGNVLQHEKTQGFAHWQIQPASLVHHGQPGPGDHRRGEGYWSSDEKQPHIWRAVQQGGHDDQQCAEPSQSESKLSVTGIATPLWMCTSSMFNHTWNLLFLHGAVTLNALIRYRNRFFTLYQCRTFLLDSRMEKKQYLFRSIGFRQCYCIFSTSERYSLTGHLKVWRFFTVKELEAGMICTLGYPCFLFDKIYIVRTLTLPERSRSLGVGPYRRFAHRTEERDEGDGLRFVLWKKLERTCCTAWRCRSCSAANYSL